MADHGANNQATLLAIAATHLGTAVTADAGLVLHDHDGHIVSANKAAETILGLSFDQMNGRTSADPRWAVIDAGGLFVPPERRPARLVLRTGRPVLDYVVGVHRPSVDATAEHLWISVTGRPLRDTATGAVTGVIAAFTVLAGPEGELLRLTESERRFRWIAQNANDMVAVLAPDATHLWVSPSCQAMTGYTPDQLVGRTFYEFLPPADAAAARDAVEAMNTRESPRLHLTGRFRHASGRLLWVESVAQPAFTADDEPGLIRVATRDVTPRITAEIARDEAQAKLRDSERRYRWIAENAGDMVAVLSPDATHLWVSPSCLALTGYRPGELLGRKVWEFLHPADVAAAGTVVTTVNAVGSRPQKLTCRFRHKDGHYVLGRECRARGRRR